MRTIYDNVFSSTNPKEVLNFKLEENLKPKRKDGSFFEKSIPYTPVGLCDDIFDLIEPIKNKELDTKIAVFYSVEMAIWLHFYGFKDVTIITKDHDQYIADRTDSFCYKYLLLDKVADMKFDVVVGNPPYSRNLHLDFLTGGRNILSTAGVGTLIHPGTWLLNEVPGAGKILNTRKAMDHFIFALDFQNPNNHFPDTDLAMVLSITSFSANTRTTPIRVHHMGSTYSVDSVDELTSHGNNEVYKNLKHKVLHGNTLKDHLNTSGNYYVCLPTMIGGSSDQLHPNNSFYSLIFKKHAFVRDELPEGSTRYFGFNTENEAENFLNYIKGYFARFCFSIAKFDRNLNPITLTTTPWMDFTQEWTDEKLFNHFGITEEEQNFIMQFIPRFYD